MKLSVVVLSALSFAALASSAFGQAPVSTGNFFGSAGGSLDTRWFVSGPAVTGNPHAVVLNWAGNPFPYSAYQPNDIGSQWISFTADGGNSMSSALTEGLWTYSTTINFSSTTGTLSGHLWSDNAITDIKVGSTDYGTSPMTNVYGDGSTSWFGSGTDFSITGLTGVQTVYFTVRNGFEGYTGSPDPTAFRAHFNPTPEPFTMGLGLAGVALFVRRRAKAQRA